MTVFNLTSPEGKEYQVEGPEGATPEQAYFILQRHLKESEPSAVGAFGRGLVRGALPAVAGMAGMGVGEIAGPVGAIAGGFGASAGTQALQEKFLESHPKIAEALGQSPEQQQADVAAHPWASEIGAIAPNVPGMARVGLEATERLAPKTVKLLESAAGKAEADLSVAEKGALADAERLKNIRMQALKTAAGSAGLMSGVNVAQQLYGGQPFDYASLLESAGIGALGTKETKLGSKIRGFGERLVGRGAKEEIVPSAVESATPHQLNLPLDETGESAPAAGGPTEPPPPPPGGPKPAAEPPAQPTETPQTPLTAILGQDAAAQYKAAVTPPPEAPAAAAPPPEPAAPAMPPETPVVPTVAKPVDVPVKKGRKKAAAAAAPEPTPEPAVSTTDEGVTELGDFVPPEDPTDLASNALEFIQSSGKTDAPAIQNALGIKLSEAKVVRQQLIDDGRLIKVKGKYEPAPKEATPDVTTEAVQPDTISRTPSVGAKPPVQLDTTEGAGTPAAVTAGLGDTSGLAERTDGGTPDTAAPLEPDDARKAVIKRLLKAQAQGQISEDELVHFKNAIDDPTEQADNYATVNQELDALTRPKSREDFLRQVGARAVAKGILKIRNKGKGQKGVPKAKKPKAVVGEDQDLINKYMQRVPEPVSGAQRTKATAAGDVGKKLNKLIVPKGWKPKEFNAAVADFMEQHPEFNEDHLPDLSQVHDTDGLSLLGNEVPTPMAREAVQKVVNDTTLGWTNPGVVGVHVTPETLHPHLRDKVLESGVRIHGIHHPQLGVHLISRELYSPEEVRATLFHEVLGHRGLNNIFGDNLDKVMRRIYESNPMMRRAADIWLDTFGKSDYYKGYEGDIKARAVEEIIARKSEAGPMRRSIGFRAALRRVTEMVRNFGRRFGMDYAYSDNDVLHIVRRAHESVMRGHAADYLNRGKLTGNAALSAVAPKTAKKAEAPKERTMDELRAEQAANIEKLAPDKSLYTRMKNFITTIRKADYEEAVRLFENERRPLIHFEKYLGKNLRIKGLLDDYNDISSRMDAAGALGRNAIVNQMNPRLKALHEAINDYARARGISLKEALADLNLYRTALHEPERRALLFAMEAPLSMNKKYALTDPKTGQVTHVIAADLRKDIILHLHQNNKYSDADITHMRGILNDLVDPKNGFLDPLGYSRTGKTSIDPNDMKQYRVAGTYTTGELQMMRDAHKQEQKDPLLNSKLQDVWDSLKDVQDRTIGLNRDARYWSTPVDNLVKFYGYEHYVPFKGDPNSNAERYDVNARRLSGSYAEYERAAEGRQSDSENTLLQSMSDAARSAARLGRADVGTAFANLIQQGWIKEKGPRLHVPFADRYNDTEITKAIQGQNKFIKYNNDGSLDVYTVHQRDQHLLDALKGEIQSREGFLRKAADKIRPITSLMGRMHTLLNVAFAPYNYARHLITNSLAISSRYGVGMIPKLFTRAAINTVTGKMGHAMRMYHAYSTEGIGALEKAAAKHGPGSFAANLYEYIKNGGDTTMMDALQVKAITQEMVDDSKRINGNLVFKTTDKLGHLFQIWAHGFELTNRATMYGVVKKQALKELAAKGIVGDELQAQAASYASNYAKNLLNFQNVGLYGRDLSSVFMFYRAAATGAVRALDALRPAWVPLEQHLKSLPENFKLTPEMVAEQTANYKKLQRNARATAIFMFGTGFAVHQIARMMAGDDEQGRNIVSTDNMDQWQRNMRFPAAFLGAGNNNSFIQFPWGYGIGALGSVGAQISGYLEGHTPFKDFIWNVLNPLRESFFPVPTANFNPLTDASTTLKWVVDSVTPSMFRPMVEAAMNIDTFGKEVTSTHISKYGDVYSAGESIPSLYRDTAEYLLEHTGLNIDPSTIQFVVNNYSDGAARLVQNFHSDVQSIEGDENYDPKRSLPAMPFSNFIGKRTSVDAKEFNDVEKDVQKMRDVMNMFASTGRVTQLQDYVASHPNAPMLVAMYNSDVNGSVKTFRSWINAVEAAPGLTPKEKHAYLQDLKLGRDMSMRGFVDLYNAANR